MLSQAKAMTDVWVFHNQSGSVVKVLFRAPKPSETPGPGIEMFKTQLSDWALAHVSQLHVRNGEVVHRPALAGI